MISPTSDNRKVKKAVFLIAGYGTRFLPASKVLPKHMLPIVDKPLIQYWVEEAVAAGIEEVIFVTSRGKSCVDDHFDKSPELEDALEKKGKYDVLRELQKIHNLAKFVSVRQIDMNGDGAALLEVKNLIGEHEPLMIVFPDYMMPYENNTLQRLVDFYSNTGKAVIAADIVPMKHVSSFGVMDIDGDTENTDEYVYRVNRFVEKPKTVEEAPSNLISTGICIITPEVIQELVSIESTGGDGEIRIADAFTKYIADGNEIYTIKPVMSGFDCGKAIGMLQANIYEGLKRPSLAPDLIEYMKNAIASYEMQNNQRVESNSVHLHTMSN